MQPIINLRCHIFSHISGQTLLYSHIFQVKSPIFQVEISYILLYFRSKSPIFSPISYIFWVTSRLTPCMLERSGSTAHKPFDFCHSCPAWIFFTVAFMPPFLKTRGGGALNLNPVTRAYTKLFIYRRFEKLGGPRPQKRGGGGIWKIGVSEFRALLVFFTV